MRLSKNLTLNEAIKSNTAIKYGIDNYPNEHQIAALKSVASNVFQPLRDHFGKPIFVSSGFRSPALNTRIGSSSTSQHCKGEALDLDADLTDELSNAEIFHFIKDNLLFDKLIWEFGDDQSPNWVHVSFSESGNRKISLVAFKDDDGNTRYKPFE